MTESKKSSRWRPGQSGNPAGRKPGTGAVTALRNQIAERLPSILAKIVEAAEAGDVQAARLLLERVIPPVRGSAMAVELPACAGSLTQRATAILDAIGKGDIAPDIGAQLVAAVGAVARVVEVDELTRRVEALEGNNEPA